LVLIFNIYYLIVVFKLWPLDLLVPHVFNQWKKKE
jgi:hypothetical protein